MKWQSRVAACCAFARVLDDGKYLVDGGSALVLTLKESIEGGYKFVDYGQVLIDGQFVVVLSEDRRMKVLNSVVEGGYGFVDCHYVLDHGHTWVMARGLSDDVQELYPEGYEFAARIYS